MLYIFVELEIRVFYFLRVFEIFFWLKVCVSFFLRLLGVLFYKWMKLFLMLFFKF